MLCVFELANTGKDEEMKREIKVCRKWQGQKNVPAISIQGFYLSEFGFEIDDTVCVEIRENEIRIKKKSKEMILKKMLKENPSLKKFIVELDCAISE